MKTLFALTFITLLFACKKEEEPAKAKEPCPEGYYGDNCELRYADKFTGAWIVYDSVVVDFATSCGTDFTHVSTHESMIYKDSAAGSKLSWITNFWGKGEKVHFMSSEQGDTLMFYYFPSLNSVKIPTSGGLSGNANFFAGNSYTHLLSSSRTEGNCKYDYTTYIRMIKK